MRIFVADLVTIKMKMRIKSSRRKGSRKMSQSKGRLYCRPRPLTLSRTSLSLSLTHTHRHAHTFSPYFTFTLPNTHTISLSLSFSHFLSSAMQVYISRAKNSWSLSPRRYLLQRSTYFTRQVPQGGWTARSLFVFAIFSLKRTTTLT